LEGEEQISLRADEIFNNAKKEVFVFASDHNINFYHSGLLDKFEKISKENVNVQLLTNYSRAPTHPPTLSMHIILGY
jgi:hypothetical protein